MQHQMNQQAVHLGKIFRIHGMLMQQAGELAAPGAKCLWLIEGDATLNNASDPCSRIVLECCDLSIASSISVTQKSCFLELVAQLHVYLASIYKASSD